MKKSILALVMASLALPTMAFLNPTQQAKLDNAWSVLTAHGVNPTVMNNNVNAAFNKTDYAGNVSNAINVFSDSASIARKGKENFFTVSGSNIISGDHSVGVTYSGTVYKFAKDGQTFKTLARNAATDYNFNFYLEEAYDHLTSPNPGIGYGTQTGINRMDSRIKNADIGDEVGSAIQDKAHGLKATIRNLGRLEAAAELAKSVESTCVNDKATNACTGLGVKFSEIGSGIETVGTAEYFTTESPSTSSPEEIWYEDPNDSSMFINATSGVTASRNNLLVGWGAATHYAEVSALDLYEDSLNDINDIAGAYIDITGPENFLFGNLTDLKGNTSSGVTNSTLSGLGI